MSRENVERFKEYIERFNRGDVAGALRYAHPEIRFEHRLVELQGDVTGIDAVRDWFVDAINLFDRWTVHCDDFRDLGDRVLALGQFRGKAGASGVEWEQAFSQLVTLKRGLVVRDQFFYSWEQGLRAAGLEPEDWT